jgi:hypothetical protein
MHFVIIKRPDLGGATGLDTPGRSYAAKVAHSSSRRRRVLQFQREKLQRQVQAAQFAQRLQQAEASVGHSGPQNILSSARRDPFSASTFVAPISTYEAALFDYCKKFISNLRMQQFGVKQDCLSRLICFKLSM